MAPQLDFAQRDLVKSMLKKQFDSKLIASEACCSMRAVQRIRLEEEQLTMHNKSKKKARRGRRSCITPSMQKALLDKLTDNSGTGMYQYEMVQFLYRKFGKNVSERSIGRALRSRGWTRTLIHRIAQQRDADLRDYYLHRISQYKSYQLVFIDESGCDRKAGYRRWGWSPKGTSPVQVTKFDRGKRWHILPAYAQDGILLRRVYQGSTDTEFFEDFIEHLLHYCGRYPEPKSVLVMDNASWHHSDRIRQMCREAGVVVEFLSPYSPDFNPIEEYFGNLKRFIQKTWHENEDFIRRAFWLYLEWCVDVVGDEEKNAEGHFRHAGIFVEQPPK
jgi:transposase